MKYVLGIDVGGTKIAAGLVDKYYRVTKAKVLPTSQADLTGQLIRLIGSYENFEAIGLALPGPVSPNGFVGRLPNVKNFKPVNFKKLLSSRFKIPVKIINDAKAFTLAEAILGSGRDYKTVAGVILGTGIGSGLVKNKKIYDSKNPLAGEIGHVAVKKGLTLEQLMQRVPKYTKPAQAEKIAALVLSLVVRTTDPDIVVFGGGRMTLPGMEGILRRSLKLGIKHPVKTKVKVSKLKHAGIIGAALPLLKR